MPASFCHFSNAAASHGCRPSTPHALPRHALLLDDRQSISLEHDDRRADGRWREDDARQARTLTRLYYSRLSVDAGHTIR